MKYITLEEVCENRTSNISQKDLKENEGIYPIYGASGLIKKVNFYTQDKEYIGIVKDGAGVGRIMLLPSKSSVIGTMQYIIPNGILDTKYLYYALISKNLSKYSSGATIPHIYFKDYKKEKIALISESEQKKVINILDRIIDIINKKKNQINLLEELVKSRFIEMFGDFENSTPIGDVCTIKARIGWQGLSKKEYLSSGEYRLVTGVDFNNGRINFENCYYVNKERYEQDDNIKIKMGDVLVTKDGTIGKVAIVDKLDIPATLNSGVFVLRNKDSTLNNIFLVYSLLSEDFKRFIENIKIGATVPHLNQSSFVKYKIKLPPLYLQEEFSQFVEKTDKLKFEAEKSLKEMENLYESLMQKFFKQN